MSHGLGIEELQNMVTQMKIRVCDYYRSIDTQKHQLQQTERELSEQLSQLVYAEQELQKMQPVVDDDFKQSTPEPEVVE